MSKIGEGLTIGAVAARTGVSEAVLRAWERRYGFPRPDRLERGHRRYGDAEVDRINRVVAERGRGRSLAAAIASVEGELVEEPSIFAGLRRERPDLPVQPLSRRTMLAISQAIEDECAAQGRRGLLVGAFQREEVYRRAQPRWDDLARTAERAIVFADFASSRRPPTGADEVALPAASPLRREWAVICEAAGWAACLVGWERPPGEQEAVGRRPFEAVWTVDPVVARHAIRLALRLAARHAPDLAVPEPPFGQGDPIEPSLVVRRATALTNRIIAYLEPERAERG